MINPNLFAFFTMIITTLPLISHAQGTCKNVAGIEPTCKAAADSYKSLDYNFCIASLQSVRNANSADLQGLAASAVQLALANAGSAESKVDDLTDLELDPAAKERYGDCLEIYEDATEKLKDSLDAINAKAYAKAARLLGSLPDAYGRCEKVCAGVQSPVTELDGNYRKLAEIGLAIVSMVE